MRRTAPSQRPSVRRVTVAWRALFVALGLVVAQGISAFHLLLVPHATCEHGELVEAGPSASRPPRSERSDHDQIAPGAAERGDHDHCDALAVRHRVPDAAMPIGAATLLVVLPLAEPGAQAEVRAIPLLALAPKASPPRA